MTAKPSVLVLQSCRPGSQPAWLRECLLSVRAWARDQGYAYEFIGDELFDAIPGEARVAVGGRKTLLADIGRACLARQRLGTGSLDYFIWLDADILVFDPREFSVRLEQRSTFCREAWVMRTDKHPLLVKAAVNNSVSLYARADPFLDFYVQACLNMILEKQASLDKMDLAIRIPTLAHEICNFPLINQVPNLSPWVIHDLLAGGGEWLDAMLRYHRRWPGAPAAANLCSSLVNMLFDGRIVLDDAVFTRLVGVLKDRGAALMCPPAIQNIQ